MKRSPQPRKAANLPESVRHLLSMYALTAGAAGLGTFVLSQPAQAKIVYTHTHRAIGQPGVIIDFNHDGIGDFKIEPVIFYSDTLAMLALSLRSNRVLGANSQAADVPVGYPVGRKGGKFSAGGSFLTDHESRVGPAKALYFCTVGSGSNGQCGGPWSKAKRGYLGFRFCIKGKIHYGWARLAGFASKPNTWFLEGYAYETVPNKPIIAGATKEAGGEDQPAGVSFKTNAPEPATLGMLALGAPGLSIWRREDGVAAPEGI